MRLITGTGLALVATFVAGVYTGVWWLLVGPIAGVLLWSVLSARSAKRHGWRTGPVHSRHGVHWTSRP